MDVVSLLGLFKKISGIQCLCMPTFQNSRIILVSSLCVAMSATCILPSVLIILLIMTTCKT